MKDHSFLLAMGSWVTREHLCNSGQSCPACADGNDPVAWANEVPNTRASLSVGTFDEVFNNEEMVQALPEIQPAKSCASHVNELDETLDTIVTYTDGASYFGQIDDGKRQGYGVYKSTSEQYDGQWHDDRQHGAGCQTWCDGRSYTGQFQNGSFSGRGRMVWQEDDGPLVYEGEYVADKKHGAGKFLWPDGHSYDGEWARGMRHGRGAYIGKTGERQVGHWSEDRLVRMELPQSEGDSVTLMLR